MKYLKKTYYHNSYMATDYLNMIVFIFTFKQYALSTHVIALYSIYNSIR